MTGVWRGTLALAMLAAACDRGVAAPAPAVSPDARLAAAPATPTPTPADDEGWTAGATTRLRVRRAKPARHDKSFGSSRLELQAVPDRRVIVSKELDGVWHVLAYDWSSRAFVIGGQFEMGAWLPLDEVRYVDEATGAVRPSRYNDGSWLAMAAVPGPDGRFVAFVGQSAPNHVPTEGSFRLQALDTAKDALFDLGPAPAPPPDADAGADVRTGRCTWGDPIDGFTEMDPGIIQFPDPTTLRATYGPDTCEKRAPKRTSRTWNLQKVATTAKMIAPHRLAEPAQIPRGASKQPPPSSEPEPHF